MQFGSTICALATPPGTGALHVIRLSGPETFRIASLHLPKLKFDSIAGRTVHLSEFRAEGKILDEVLVTVFKSPASYTKEDTCEFSCHGSPFIAGKILESLIHSGAQMAEPGEFTLRAFMNGRFDLTQAEAVADLIAAESPAGIELAIQQMRGGFSKTILKIRTELIHFASLLELELDFSEEDVEFANRNQMRALVQTLIGTLTPLIQSFSYGNVIKTGFPVAITGLPNAGKSTLLNRLLNEDRALVTDIPGTTRDVIEAEIMLEGIRFRFIDTAGIRETLDKVEAMGIAKTREKISTAGLILLLHDPTEPEVEFSLLQTEIETSGTPYVLVCTKLDLFREKDIPQPENGILLSATTGEGIEKLKTLLVERVLQLKQKEQDVVIANVRHLDGLTKTKAALENVLQGIDIHLPTELLSLELRSALHQLGQLTGTITTDDLLDNIFSKFCIGK